VVKTINVEQALNKDAIFIDTRSPKEFQDDHLPNAINLPILDNDERHLIGTIYKQVSKDEAIEQGKEIFEKKLPHFEKELSKHKDKTIIVNCFRGGMRSRAVVATFSNFNILQLEGGYKAYRSYVRTQLQNYEVKPQLIVLCGLTCTGKTDLLKLLPNSIDLEGLAQHRSSMYGAVGLQPNSQKRFESLLLQQLNKLNNQTYVFIEGESRRIGDVIIPDQLWKKMVNGTKILITRTLNNRATACVQEYFKEESNIKQIREVTTRLFKVISKENQNKVLHHIDNKEYHEAAKILLEKYYDPLYEHTLNQFKFGQHISSDNLQEAKEKLKKLIN
jgi:tRNA 2-selenouridine synthase